MISGEAELAMLVGRDCTCLWDAYECGRQVTALKLGLRACFSRVVESGAWCKVLKKQDIQSRTQRTRSSTEHSLYSRNNESRDPGALISEEQSGGERSLV